MGDTSITTERSVNVTPMTYADARLKIKDLVDKNQTFSEVLESFNVEREDDKNVVSCYYTEILIKTLPFKGKEYLQSIFESKDDDILINWMNAIYNSKADKDIKKLLQKAPFYKCMKELKELNDEIDFSSFFLTLRKEFSSIFISFHDFDGIIEIYQCLLRCQKLPRSEDYCKAVKMLWNKFKNQFKNDVLELESENEANTEAEHQRLAKLVESFEGVCPKPIEEMIKDLFKPTRFTIVYDGSQAELKITGYKIVLSLIHDKLVEKLASSYRINQIIVQSQNEFIVDQSFTFPGITFSIAAKKVKFSEPIQINLSGKNAVNDREMMHRADDATEPGEKGKDGKDGKAGQSSGNFILLATIVDGLDNVKLILNGGNGAYGQDGGDGKDGVDGVGLKFNEIFTRGYALRKGAKHFANLMSMGGVSRLFDKKTETRKQDGSVETLRSDSAYYFWTHSVDFYKGSDGGVGGKGGKNGLGGEGGKKGNHKIKIDRKIHNDDVIVEANEGKKGADGNPGKNGDFGNEGWDIALIKQSISGQKTFGESEKEKLTIEYGDKPKMNSIYIQAEDKGPGSKCYVEVHPRDCVKKTLKESEKWTEHKEESERSGESMAIEAVSADTASLNQDYQEIVLSGEATEAQETSETVSNELENVTRIMEFWTDLEEIPYVKKTKQEPLIFPESDLNSLDFEEATSEIFWKRVTNFSIRDVLEQYEGSEFYPKLAQKHIIFELRRLRKTIQTLPRKEEVVVSYECLVSTNENIKHYVDLFNILRKADQQTIDNNMLEIQQAFSMLKIPMLKTLIKKCSVLGTENDYQNPVFEGITTAYKSLPDAIQNTNSEQLFHFVKLLESIVVNNVFYQCLSEEEYQEKNIKDFLILQNRRFTQSLKFKKELEDLEKKYELENLISDMESPLEDKLEAIFKMVGSENDTIYLHKELEFLCQTCSAVGRIFVNTLQLIFEVEGCHIDAFVLKYLVNTVFDACKMYGYVNCYTFPSILLITKQDQWIDHFFAFNVESIYQKCFQEKTELVKILKKFKDENLKILCTQKLFELPEASEDLKEENLIELLSAIKDSEMIYPYLQNVELERWQSIMEKVNLSKNLNSKRFNSLKENDKNTVIFWCTKLTEHFDVSSVQNVVDLIIDFLNHEKRSAVGRFMHRLCDAGNVVNTTTRPLRDILEASLHCLKEPEATKNNNTECYKIAKELLASVTSIKPREFDEIKTLCQKLNVENSSKDTTEYVLNLLEHECNESVADRIRRCVHFVAHTPMVDEIDTSSSTNGKENDSFFSEYQNHSKIDNIRMFLYNQFSECQMDLDLFYLLIIDDLIFKQQQERFRLRDTQKIAILCALKEFDPSKKANGILQQISTGEGKTLIIAALSIINVLKKKKVNIITSSSVLAKRDVLNPPCVKLYECFGLKVDHICYDCPQRRQNVYSKCDIIFGDLTSYQRDFLMDKFYSTKIGKSRKMW